MGKLEYDLYIVEHLSNQFMAHRLTYAYILKKNIFDNFLIKKLY